MAVWPPYPYWSIGTSKDTQEKIKRYTTDKKITVKKLFSTNAVSLFKRLARPSFLTVEVPQHHKFQPLKDKTT